MFGKWIIDKIGTNGASWIGRAIAAVTIGLAAHSCWFLGKTEGITEAYKTIDKTMDSK